MDEDRLIQGCKDRSPLAQRTLVDQYSGLLYNVSLRYAVDRAEAKDILQESWVKIFKGIDGYKNQGQLRGWMSRIVINTALRKMQGSEKRSAVYVETFYDPPQVSSEAISQLQYDDLLRLVNSLPEISREVFKMVSIDGLKHKEVAELLKIEESTSRAHLTRARAKLRVMIEKIEKPSITQTKETSSIVK